LQSQLLKPDVAAVAEKLAATIALPVGLHLSFLGYWVLVNTGCNSPYHGCNSRCNDHTVYFVIYQGEF